MRNLLILLLLTSFLKEAVFLIIVPIWHFPDEQAQFGQVTYLAEFGKVRMTNNNLTQEIYDSEVFLGTFRDKDGNNKFTYHPDYKIEYTNTSYGIYEKLIKSLPKEYRRNLVIEEATVYPPLYYIISALPYRLFYNEDLINRVYAVRLIAVMINVLTIYICWKIGKALFKENKLMQYLLPVLISFQPMFSFISAGVNSDNLMNLLFAALIYLGILIIQKGLNLRYGIYIVGLMVLGYFTKVQFILGAPIILVAIVGSLFKFNLNKKGLVMILTVLLTMVILSTYPLISYFNGSTYPISFFEHLKNTIIHSTKEVIPWYWGVFDWLGVVLPIDIIRILNRIMIIAGIGILIKLLTVIRYRKYKENLEFIFLLFTAIIYFLGITFFDYLYIKSNLGVGIGIQGRYFFPTITAHLYLLIIGWITFWRIIFKFIKTFKLANAINLDYVEFLSAKVLGYGMLILNFVALWLITNTYYKLSLNTTFFYQLSQYKPEILKYPFNLGIFIIYLIFVCGLVYYYSFLDFKKNSI